MPGVEFPLGSFQVPKYTNPCPYSLLSFWRELVRPCPTADYKDVCFTGLVHGDAPLVQHLRLLARLALGRLGIHPCPQPLLRKLGQARRSWVQPRLLCDGVVKSKGDSAHLTCTLSDSVVFRRLVLHSPSLVKSRVHARFFSITLTERHGPRGFVC